MSNVSNDDCVCVCETERERVGGRERGGREVGRAPYILVLVVKKNIYIYNDKIKIPSHC